MAGWAQAGSLGAKHSGHCAIAPLRLRLALTRVSVRLGGDYSPAESGGGIRPDPTTHVSEDASNAAVAPSDSSAASAAATAALRLQLPRERDGKAPTWTDLRTEPGVRRCSPLAPTGRQADDGGAGSADGSGGRPGPVARARLDPRAPPPPSDPRGAARTLSAARAAVRGGPGGATEAAASRGRRAGGAGARRLALAGGGA